MRASDLKKHEGEVIVLDLINGVKLTTKLEKVADDGFAVLGKLIEFHVIQQLKDRSKPPTPENVENVVTNTFYGFPLFEVGEGNVIDSNHILLVIPTNDEMQKVYLSVTSKIQIAGTEVLKKLDAVKAISNK